MELFEAIDTRSSAARLAEPGPSRAELDRLLHAGGRAPDHGRLQPWRFIVLGDAQRDEFGRAAASAKRARLPAMTEEQFASEREKIARSPTIVVAACVVERTNTKVPEIEQVVAVGALLTHLERDFDGFNAIYHRYFADDEQVPSRTTVGVAKLGRDALVEVDLVLYRRAVR